MNPPVKNESKQGIVLWAAQEYGIDAGKVLAVLKQTCFRPSKQGEEPPSDAEVAALMVVARAHGLNPFLRQIYAFKDKRGGIVPVVGVDGWAQLINDNDYFNGVEFEYNYNTEDPEKKKLESVTCIIYDKRRDRATRITEFLDECRRDTEPWRTAPRRMLRHKALIQCARIAFSFSGIYDDDEAARIIDGTATEVPLQVGEVIQREPDQPEVKPEAKPSAAATLAGELAQRVAPAEAKPGAWKTPAEIKTLIADCKGLQDLNAVLPFISELPDTPERADLMKGWNSAVQTFAGSRGEPPVQTAGDSLTEIGKGE